MGDSIDLKVSVSGIRGIWGNSLTLDNIKDYVNAFGEYIRENSGKAVLLGRDSRPTGRMISAYTASILNSAGLDVYDAGVVPTPTILFGVRENGYDAGIIITASHNPIEWNALKFVKRNGVFTGEKDIELIISKLGKKIETVPYNKIGTYNKDIKAGEMHMNAILKKTDAELVKSKSFRVVLDPVNSAGAVITENMLKRLGCEVIMVNGEINGTFGRGAEPIASNLVHLGEIVRRNGADIGFAQDPDADRLVTVDEKGNVLSEEKTLAFAVESVLSRKKGDIVVNLSTSSLEDWLAAKYGVKCLRTKVGEANVTEGIISHGAVIGGEGNGGVIYPEMNLARDSLAGVALILELMANTGCKLSDIDKNFPAYIMRKEKFNIKGRPEKILRKAAGLFPFSEINEIDGVRMDWKEKDIPVWIHIRCSNTEPVVRVIGESLDREILDGVFLKISSLFY